MKNAILWALVVLSFFGSVYAHLRIRDVENGFKLQELTLEGLQKRTTRPAVEHRYRFGKWRLSRALR